MAKYNHWAFWLCPLGGVYKFKCDCQAYNYQQHSKKACMVRKRFKKNQLCIAQRVHIWVDSEGKYGLRIEQP